MFCYFRKCARKNWKIDLIKFNCHNLWQFFCLLLNTLQAYKLFILRSIMKNRIIISILVLLPVAIFFNSGLLELRLEEPRRALVAIEMLLRHNYLVPEINGHLYYTKPPLFNWAIAFSFWLAG